MIGPALYLAATVCLAPPIGATVANDPAAAEEYRSAAAAYEAGAREKAGKQLEEFRRAHPDHPLAWQAGLLWARCTTEPAEAEKRFRAVAERAPEDTKAECELELAHLAVVQEHYAPAEEAYTAWLAAHGHDERAEAASFWQAQCQRELGRKDEALVAWKRLRDKGRQPVWRAQAGLAASSLLLEQGKAAEARREALGLVEASWARDVRPQARLVAAKADLALKRTGEARTLLAELAKENPDLPEAEEARTLLGAKTPAGPRFGVQVAAFSRKAAAAAEREKYVKAGRAATLLTRPSGSLMLYGVVLGPYASHAEAEQAREQLRQKGTEAFIITY